MTEERNQRKVYQGRVVSDKMDKTITVVVETKKNHPIYGKRMKYSKKYKAHDENNTAKVGDIVNHGNSSIISYKTFPFTRGSRRSSYYLIKREFPNRLKHKI